VTAQKALAPSTMRSTRVAVASAFLAQGLLFASLLTRLPAFKDRWDIGDGVVTVVILGVALLAGAGSTVAGALAGRLGSGRVLRVAIAVIALSTLLIGLAPDLPVFFAGFAVYGVGVGAVDATSNMQAVELQHRYGRSILTSFHAVWSAAGIAGALFTSATTHLDWPLGAALAVPAVLVLAIAAWSGSRFLFADVGGAVTLTALPALVVPWRPVLLLGAAMVCFYVVDSGTSSWSTIYLDDMLHASQSVAALGFAAYQATSLISRAGGDLLVRRWGATTVVRAGGLLGTAGVLAVVAAPSAVIAIAGFALVGLGLAVVAPLSFAACGALAPGAADSVVARVNLFNYVGFVVGGVLVGVVGTSGNLRWGFVVPLVAAALIVALAPAFSPRPGGAR
jgi:MFS family permease